MSIKAYKPPGASAFVCIYFVIMRCVFRLINMFTKKKSLERFTIIMLHSKKPEDHRAFYLFLKFTWTCNGR